MQLKTSPPVRHPPPIPDTPPFPPHSPLPPVIALPPACLDGQVSPCPPTPPGTPGFCSHYLRRSAEEAGPLPCINTQAHLDGQVDVVQEGEGRLGPRARRHHRLAQRHGTRAAQAVVRADDGVGGAWGRGGEEGGHRLGERKEAETLCFSAGLGPLRRQTHNLQRTMLPSVLFMRTHSRQSRQRPDLPPPPIHASPSQCAPPPARAQQQQLAPPSFGLSTHVPGTQQLPVLQYI